MVKSKSADMEGQSKSAAVVNTQDATKTEQELEEANAAALVEGSERKVAQKPPLPPPTRGLVWAELSEEDVKLIRTLEGPHSIANFLSKHFGLHDLLYKDIAASAINDLTLHATLFALENDFTDEQCSAFVSIVKKVTQYAMGRNYLADRVGYPLPESKPVKNARQSNILINSKSNNQPDATQESTENQPTDSEQAGDSHEQKELLAKGIEVLKVEAQVPVESEMPSLPTAIDMLPSLAESFALFRKLTLQHSVNQRPDSHEIFNIEDVQAIVEFLKSNLFVAFEAYQLLSIHASESELLPVTKVVVETPMLPGILLMHAVSTEILSNNHSTNQEDDESAVLAGVPDHLRSLVEQLVELESKSD